MISRSKVQQMARSDREFRIHGQYDLARFARFVRCLSKCLCFFLINALLHNNLRVFFTSQDSYLKATVP